MIKNLSILKHFIAIAALLFIVTSCSKNEEIEVNTSDQEIPFVGDPDAEPIFATYEVAIIQKDGHEYVFEAIGDEGDMVIVEKLYGSAEDNFEASGVAEGYFKRGITRSPLLSGGSYRSFTRFHN